MSSLSFEHGSLVLRTPYNQGLVAELKARIPSTERAWDKGSKAWVLDPKHGKLAADLVGKHLGEMIFIPAGAGYIPPMETRILEVRYLGTTKDRGDGERSAFGFYNEGWNAVFPESVLVEWFTGVKAETPEAQAPATLYAVLGIPRTAEEETIKKAFRRLARQWHPDVCKEEGAAEMFMRIQSSYDLLSNPNRRARYDAGLALEESIKGQTEQDDYGLANGYRAPLRCGLLIAEGAEKVGRFVVSKIQAWEDIIDPKSRTLVVSWPAGADRWIESWI